MSGAGARRRWGRLGAQLGAVSSLPVLLLALGLTAPRLAGQGTPPVRRDSAGRPGAAARGTPGDTLRRSAADSAAADSARKAELVKWADSDPVIDSLLAKQGYTITRYQGGRVVFDAGRKLLTLERDSSQRAAVGRDRTIMVSDTIVYDDSTKVIQAKGAENVLRDPDRGGDDVLSRGRMFYNTIEKRGTVGGVRTTFVSGQKYFVEAARAGFSTDSAEASFFGRLGSVTTCDDSVPHYHFNSRELKMVKGRLAVGRPGVLYIYDTPVFWLPFYFQDLRRGRRSGMLTPRIAATNIVRNGPLFRRNVENVGWYFNLNEYQDLSAWLDWRSSANPRPDAPQDFGFTRYNLDWRYNWLNRQLSGGLGASYTTTSNGATNLLISVSHKQAFSRRSNLSAQVNYATNTSVQRNASFTAAQQLGTIRSSANWQTQFGSTTVSVGGSRTQYPGRTQVDEQFPTLSINTKPIAIGEAFTWSPSLSATASANRNQLAVTQSSFLYRIRDGALDSVALPQNRRDANLTFNTPIQIFGFNWDNSFTIQDGATTGLQQRDVDLVVGTDTIRTTRFFNSFTLTSVDWRTGINLPALFRGTWNLTPSVQFTNIDGASAFWVRSSLSGGRYVRQGKRPNFGLSIAPTLYARVRGLGPVAAIRHSFQPSLSWTFAPAATVSDEFLIAAGRSRRDFLGAIRQNVLALSIQQSVEVKLRDAANPDSGRKVRALSLQLDPLSYNFEQLPVVRERVRQRGGDPSKVRAFAGLQTSSYGIGFRSDFLPGFDFGTRWSLFLGDPASDTAIFRPYNEEVRTSFKLDRNSGMVKWLARRLFGAGEFTAAPSNLTAIDSMQARNDSLRAGISRPINAGQVAPGFGVIPSGQGWTLSVNYNASRQRPPVGVNLNEISVEDLCRRTLIQQGALPQEIAFLLPQCVNSGGRIPGVDLNANNLGRGALIIRNPPIQSLQLQTSFNLTPKWAAQWGTTYDLVRREFAMQNVTLQRELHDWRANFTFSQAPNGAFAFSFFISLKAQPDLKFDFREQTFPRQGQLR